MIAERHMLLSKRPTKAMPPVHSRSDGIETLRLPLHRQPASDRDDSHILEARLRGMTTYSSLSEIRISRSTSGVCRKKRLPATSHSEDTRSNLATSATAVFSDRPRLLIRPAANTAKDGHPRTAWTGLHAPEIEFPMWPPW